MTQESAQRKKNRNALTAAIKRLGEHEAQLLIAMFSKLDHNCKRDWVKGNCIISNLLDDGFSHNQIRQLLRVGGTRIRRITREKPSRMQIAGDRTDDDDISVDSTTSSRRRHSLTIEERNEIKQLREDIKELESYIIQQRRAQRNISPISWKEVAYVMEMMRNASLEERQKLLLQTQASSRLIDLLYECAQYGKFQTMPKESWAQPQLALGHATVVAHPDARIQGLEWLTNVVYHNTDRMMQRYFYSPNVTDRQMDGYFDFSSPEQFLFVVRNQIEIPAPIESVLPLFQDGYIRLQSGLFTKAEMMEISERFTLTRLDEQARRDISPDLWYIEYAPIGHANGTKNLFRVFYEPDRVVVSGQTIFHDELTSTPDSGKKNVTWVILERLPHGHTRLRALSLISSTMTKDGFYSLEDEAMTQGLDLSECPEDSKENKFAQFMAPHLAASIQSLDSYMTRIF